MNIRWYVATLLVRIRVEDDQPHEAYTCDEQIRVLRATNDTEAFEKAMALGRNEETSYKNGDGQSVFWEFVGLISLEPLMDDAIEDGTEIKSHLFSHVDSSSLVLPRSERLHQSR